VKKLNGKRAVEYEKRGVIPEFGVMSRRPGIGDAYAKKYACELVNRGYAIVKGSKVVLPRFYQSKIFTTDESLRVREQRRQQHDYDDAGKRRQLIAERGYVGAQNVVDMQRQKLDDDVKGKLRLKRRKG